MHEGLCPVTSTRVLLPILLIVLVLPASSSSQVLVQDGSSQGQGVLWPRLGTCTVVTPLHVVRDAFESGGTVLVKTAQDSYRTLPPVFHWQLPVADWDMPAAESGRTDGLVVFELEDYSPCEGPQHSLEPVKTEDLSRLLLAPSDAPFRLLYLSDSAQNRVMPVDLTRADSFVSFIPRGHLYRKGISGALLQGPSGRAAGMVLWVTGDEATLPQAMALPWETVREALSPYYFELRDVDLSCDSNSEIVVDEPIAVSVLLEAYPDLARQGAGWRLENVAQRLSASPTLTVRSILSFDTPVTIAPCRLELESEGVLTSSPGGAVRVAALGIDFLGGTVAIHGEPGAEGKAGSNGSRGRSHSRGGRRGCGKTEHGGRGGAGSPGEAGQRGGDAGQVFLAAHSMSGTPQIELRGGNGGQGGDGGAGGAGGDGAGATSGSSSAFDCKCGGNPGGRGGDGGAGGSAGDGGNGGGGGELTIISTQEIPTLEQVSLVGGEGGAPGDAGRPGPGGKGGNKSGGTGFCKGERGGSNGSNGQNGKPGTSGSTGDAGRIEQELIQEQGRPDPSTFFSTVLTDLEFGLARLPGGESES